MTDQQEALLTTARALLPTHKLLQDRTGPIELPYPDCMVIPDLE